MTHLLTEETQWSNSCQKVQAFKEAYKLFGIKRFAHAKHNHPQTRALLDLNNTCSVTANSTEAISFENLLLFKNR